MNLSLFDPRPASFGGAPFFVSQSSDAFGRRGAHHEFPYADKGLWDDLGPKDGRRQLSGFVTNDSPGGCASARDRLMAALDKGPGELSHPWLGRKQVVCIDYSVAHQDKELGLARFEMTFIDAAAASGPALNNPVAGLLDFCDRALGRVAALFASGFSLDAALDFVGDISLGYLDKYIAVARQGLAMGREISAALAPFFTAAKKWAGEADYRGGAADFGRHMADDLSHNFLSQSPAENGRDLAGLVRALVPASGDFSSALKNLKALFDFSRKEFLYPAAPEWGGAESLMAVNQNLKALNDAFAGAAWLERARLTPWLDFDSRAAAELFAAELLRDFDFLAAGQNDDAFYRLGRAACAEAFEIIASRAPNLALIGRHDLRAETPALVLAYRLLNDLEGADALCRRNNIRHPGFAPGGLILEYPLREA